jgi:hypothetical protein
MADYYPLIARAVAGLEKNIGEGRRALYERARTALLEQLRGVTPTLSETDITRERLALEEAIRKVEADAVRPQPEASETPLYNVIMTAASGAWDVGSAKVLRSRFLEHTNATIAERFRSLTPSVISQLIALPTLFAYETTTNGTARVGKLLDIHITDRTLDIRFEFDSSIPPIVPEKFAEIRERLGINNIEQHRTHWAIKNIDLLSVLSEVGLAPIESVPSIAPTEPSSGPGPQYRPRNGKLSEDVSPPAEDEAAQQFNLHRKLKYDAIALTESLRRVNNRYPELARAALEYSALLDVEVASVDVTGIWSVGGSLASFSQAYREQNIARTLAEPLEPQLEAQLQSVVRQHGAFVMGFAEGRDLVQRADEFVLDTIRLREIEAPGAILLDQLANNSDLVDDRTRAIHKPVRDAVMEFGWATSRAGYSAYLVVRNCARAMIKFSVGESPNAGAIFGLLTGVSVLVGDPNAEFIRAAVPVLKEHGSQLLLFFNHSPEMRAYVEWALKILDDDRANEKRQ